MGTEPDQTHHVMPLCHHSATTELAWSGREAEFTNYLYVNGKWLPAALAIAIFELNYHTPWLCCSVVYCSYCRPHAQWPMVVVAGWGCTMCDCDCIHDMICPNVSWFGQFLLLGCAIFVPSTEHCFIHDALLYVWPWLWRFFLITRTPDNLNRPNSHSNTYNWIL